MAERTIPQAMEFDKSYLRLLMGAPIGNHNRLQIVVKALHIAIESELTPRQRELVTMHYFEQMPNVAIARALHLSPSTVSRTLTRARARLQHSMRFYVEFLNCVSLED